nr:reverse transcriptase domain-containing protein [Tanacetum cinerariifolium]
SHGTSTVSRRLRRHSEAYPITVITDKPIKQILNKAETSGRLAKYSMELGAYNILYEPRSAIKGQILADFINEVPIGSEAMYVPDFEVFEAFDVFLCLGQASECLLSLLDTVEVPWLPFPMERSFAQRRAEFCLHNVSDTASPFGLPIVPH